MPAFIRRFRRNARTLVIVAAVVFTGLLVAGFLLAGSDLTASFVFWGVAAAMIVAAVALVLSSRSRALALRRVRGENPDGVVFLARRQPAAISDLATVVTDPEIYDQISDRWVVASIDDRGMSAWSLGADSRELVLMPWRGLGYVEFTRLDNGSDGVAVDVKPFPEPLVVSVGYTAFGIMASFSKRGVRDVVEAANAFRPESPRDTPAG